MCVCVCVCVACGLEPSRQPVQALSASCAGRQRDRHRLPPGAEPDGSGRPWQGACRLRSDSWCAYGLMRALFTASRRSHWGPACRAILPVHTPSAELHSADGQPTGPLLHCVPDLPSDQSRGRQRQRTVVAAAQPPWLPGCVPGACCVLWLPPCTLHRAWLTAALVLRRSPTPTCRASALARSPSRTRTPQTAW